MGAAGGQLEVEEDNSFAAAPAMVLRFEVGLGDSHGLYSEFVVAAGWEEEETTVARARLDELGSLGKDPGNTAELWGEDVVSLISTMIGNAMKLSRTRLALAWMLRLLALLTLNVLRLLRVVRHDFRLPTLVMDSCVSG